MDSIVLLSKQKGMTSFASLGVIKKALNTTKVGHTGTLDSFAQGLLVVCTGRFTRLAGNITEFDKSYTAVIKFGAETDTLEYTGNIISQAELPSKQQVIDAVKKFTGVQKQIPPLFSAIHIDGKRASDIARNGSVAEIPEREITVYKAEIKDFLLKDNKVLASLIEFSVSKGTYVRSLARDIGKACGSCAYLIGLQRTKVGNFCLEDAAGYNSGDNLSIEAAIQDELNYLNSKDLQPDVKFNRNKNDDELKAQILSKLKTVDESVAELCGFVPLHLRDASLEFNIKNGKPVQKKWFVEYVDGFVDRNLFAIFDTKKALIALLERIDSCHFSYKFVIN